MLLKSYCHYPSFICSYQSLTTFNLFFTSLVFCTFMMMYLRVGFILVILGFTGIPEFEDSWVFLHNSGKIISYYFFEYSISSFFLFLPFGILISITLDLLILHPCLLTSILSFLPLCLSRLYSGYFLQIDQTMTSSAPKAFSKINAQSVGPKIWYRARSTFSLLFLMMQLWCVFVVCL